MQIMYGIRGERDLTEQELPHLSGYNDSRPVRIGNGAASQKQLDVLGRYWIVSISTRTRTALNGMAKSSPVHCGI